MDPIQLRLILLVLLAFMATGCSALGLGRATPTPEVENAILDRFLARAPAPNRVPSTATPDTSSVLDIPRGLPLPLADPLTVEGDLFITGSPALGALTRQIYNRFVAAGYRDTMKIEEVGSTAGFQRYCGHSPSDPQGADIVMVDRSITQQELELCLSNQRTPIALRVGLDAVTVVVNENVDFIPSVSKADLATIFTSQRWSDVTRGWPDVEIIHVVPTTEHMAFTIFADKILGSDAFILQNAPPDTFRQDGQEIALGIADTPYTIGFLNFADYQDNANGLGLLAVDGLRPTGVTVSNGTYPLTYTLLLYTDLETLTTKAQAGAFLMYYLNHVNEVILSVGNFPLSEPFFERTKSVLLTALGQDDYLAQFPPTNTPHPQPTATATLIVTVTTVE